MLEVLPRGNTTLCTTSLLGALNVFSAGPQYRHIKKGYYFNRSTKFVNLKPWRSPGSNPRYSWVTYFIWSNFCNFSQLVLSTHPLLLYQFLSPYQSFVVLSNVCHLLAPCYLFTFCVIFSPYKCTCCTHHTHNALSCFIVRTLSAPIQFPNSPGVFGHRAILTMGGIGPWLGVSL